MDHEYVPRSYAYAHEKFCDAMVILVASSAPLQDRLGATWLKMLMLMPEDLPEGIREEFASVRDQMIPHLPRGIPTAEERLNYVPRPRLHYKKAERIARETYYMFCELLQPLINAIRMRYTCTTPRRSQMGGTMLIS